VEESAQMRADGARVLTEGLPALPVGITLSNETPVGSWQTEDYGFVAFVTGSPDGRSDIDPGIRFLQYERIHDEWIPMFPSTWWRVEGLPGAPAEREVNAVSLGGGLSRLPRKPREEGGGDIIVWGWCSKHVARLSLVQHQDRVNIPILHFGFWVIGIQNDGPWTVEASDGAVVAWGRSGKIGADGIAAWPLSVRRDRVRSRGSRWHRDSWLRPKVSWRRSLRPTIRGQAHNLKTYGHHK
jgi:hypothetical protein